jgi:putative MATE family efflux protein
MARSPVDMGSDRVLPALFRLGAPAMVSMFFETLYGLVDTFFIARLGTLPLAALALAIPFMYFAMSLCKGTAVGSLALMSHARGADRPAEATEIARAAFPLLLVLVGGLMLLALPGVNRPIFALFDRQPALLHEVDSYLRWLALSFPVMGFAMLCEAIFFSYGDTRTPMLAMIAGNLLNMVLDPLLIFSCGMGIGGASLASLLGWALAGGLMYRALRRRGRDTPALRPQRKDLARWPQIVHLGAPVALSMLIIPIAGTVLNYLMAGFGPACVGAWNLSARIERMVILPLYGLASSLVPFIGFNLGRQRYDRIAEGCKVVRRGGYLLLGPTVLLFWFKSRFLIGLFAPPPEVLEMGAFALKVAGLGYFLLPYELVTTSLSQGLKKPRYSLFISALRLLALRLPLAVLFAAFWGGRGIYISHPVSLLLSGMVSFFILRHLLADSRQPSRQP